MTFLPVVGREMLALSRRKGTYWARVVMGLVAIGVMIYLLFLSYSQISFVQQGKSVFIILSSLSFGYALLAGVAATSDCVSEEKREGTLGLLFLTDLKGYDVVFGKLTASSLSATLGLAAIVPVLAMALLLGGVLLQEVALVALVLANTLFLSLAAGVLVSSYSTNERRSMLACLVLLFLIVLGPYLAALGLTKFEHTPEEYVWPSPLYAFLCLHLPAAAGMDHSYFWVSVIIQHCLAWTFLAWSSRTVPKFINQLPPRKFLKLQEAFHRWVFGSEQKRLRHRRRLLDRNAFMWLASREQAKKQYAWSMLVFFGALYFWIYYQYPSMGLDLVTAGVILFLTHILFKLWLASEVCSRLIEDRRSGALELLLTTPMTIREMARGQQMALRRIFGGPVLVLLSAEIFLFVATAKFRSGPETWVFYSAAISTLLLDLWALKWVGLWNSLFGKSIEKVLISTLVRVLAMPWIIFALIMGFIAAVAHATGYDIKDAQILKLWWAISIVVSLFAGATARSSFLAHFRDAAAHRFDAKPVAQSSFNLWLADALGRFAFFVKVSRRLPVPVKRHPVFCVLLFFFAIVFAGTYGRQLYWQYKLNHRLDAIRQRGEPARLAEIPKYLPPVPPEENGLTQLERAGGVNWFGLNVGGLTLEKRLSSDERDRLKKALSINSAALAALHSMTNYQKGYRAADGTAAAWSGFNALYGYPLLMRMELVEAFQTFWDSDSASLPRTRIETDMSTLLALARVLRDVPFEDAQTTCYTSLETFRDSLQRGLQLMNFDPAILDQWKKTLAEIEQIQMLRQKLVVTRTIALAAWQNPGLFGAQSQQYVAAAMGGVTKTIGTKDRIACESMDQFEDALRLAGESFQKCADRYATNLPVPAGPGLTFPFGERAVSTVLSLEGAIQAQFQVLKTAIAVEKYRKSKRTMPSNLAQLVPEYLKDIPNDPFGSGAPLIFKADKQKTLIYSISVNRQDDNGQAIGWYLNGDIAFKFSE